MSEGTEARADVEELMFGSDGEDPLGVSCLRIRDQHQDDHGRFVPKKVFRTRAFFIPTQLTNPYQILEIGMDNLRNANPNAVILPYSGGEPHESDKVVFNNWTWKMTNLNPLYVGDDIVFYQAEIARTGRVGVRD